MRLWHQSRTELARLPGYHRLLEEHLRTVAGRIEELERSYRLSEFGAGTAAGKTG